MCNRYIPRWSDRRLFDSAKLAVPRFEEFSERTRFGSSGGTSSMLAPPSPSEPEARPKDRSPVVRVVGNEMRLDLLQWGLVPAFSPEPTTRYSTFNAQAETVATKPAYREAWAAGRRCLIPTDAFFEWKGEKPPKQKYRIGLKGGAPFCLGGLWEKWQRDNQVLETFTIITTAANALVAEIHAKQRMPLILAPNDYDRWLHDTGDVSDLLRPYSAELMEALPVSKPPHKPDDDGPSLFA